MRPDFEHRAECAVFLCLKLAPCLFFLSFPTWRTCERHMGLAQAFEGSGLRRSARRSAFKRQHHKFWP